MLSATEEQNFESMARMVREQNETRSGNTQGATKSGVCKMFLHSTCNIPCGFSHDISRVPSCQNYSNNLCKYGNSCEFSHQGTGVPNIRRCNNLKNHGYCENTECKYKHTINVCLEFEKGYCRNGSQCTFAHVKKEICKNYMYGFCPEGPNCQYAHPKILIDRDAEFYRNIDSKIKIIKCNKCDVLGHKSNNCSKQKTVEVLAPCEKCNCWHWKDNPCVYYEDFNNGIPVEGGRN